jgi:hypothetical protein
MMVPLRNKTTGKIISQKIGWSWTCLFFSAFFGIPLFSRKLYGCGAVMLLLVSYQSASSREIPAYQYSTAGVYVGLFLAFLPIVLIIIFAATANRMAGRKYLRHGWEFAEPDSGAARIAQQKWGLVTGGAFSKIPGLLTPLEPPPLQLSTASSPETPVLTPKLAIGIDERSIVSGSDYDRRRSYIVRHWRGELSLPVSYWINSFLGAVAVFAVFSCIGRLIAPTDSPLGFAIVVSGAWFFLMVANSWQLVGVWRSAGKHKGRGGSGFWAGLARVMVILGFLGLAGSLSEQTLPQLKESWNIAFGDPEMGKHELHILRGGTELEFTGGITFGVTEEVRKLLDADPSIWVIHLHSPGGRVAEARELRDLIRQRGLSTYTAIICASACTVAFMGGAQRFIAPEAKLGFHRGSFPGATDEQLAQEYDAGRSELVAMGVPQWFADRAYSTPSNSMWWPTLGELAQADVVTAIASPEDFALRDLDNRLLKNPLYVAIKGADPEVYSKILSATMDAVRLGKSEAEVEAVARPYISALLQKYLPVSSDGAIISTAQLFVSKAEAIGSQSADACYDFFNSQTGSPSIIPGDNLATDAQQRDAIITDVIETGSSNPQPTPTEAQASPLSNVIVKKLLKKYPASDVATLDDPSCRSSTRM